MRVAACPSTAALERLFLGGLPAGDAEAIEQHVLECDACSGQLEQLFRAKEPLSGALREKAGKDPSHSNPVVDDLIRKVESLRPTSGPVPQDKAMIAITCSSCQKKLTVKEALAGKKVKCPGCGVLLPVPAALPVGAAESAELRTLPPSPEPANAPAHLDAATAPTHPPLEKPDATIAVKHDVRHESSLTDFLAPPQADDELGRLGKYRILKVLGHGGMGVVFKGEDLKLKRTVAIKAMLPALAASASSGKRFMREAEAMAAVEHDHIVRIYQVDDERGIPFMAMEFLKGEPLDERLKRDEPLPLEDMLRIGREIAEGLNAAHTTGLIHRDIKPGNIWLEAPRNRVKILDFGLARAATQEAGLTQQGAIIGTPAYMSPEQGRGDNVDARCDLFSLGVVLYRMCTGQQPFHGKDTVSTLMAVAMNDPLPPIKVNKALSPELSKLVMALLEKDPAQRTASAAEVVQAIQAIEKKLAWDKMNAGKTEAIHAPDTQLAVTAKPRAKAARNVPSKAEGTSTTEVPPRRRSKAVIAVGLLAVFGLLGACLAGGGIFYWQTNNGTVKIEINDKDIQVSFDKKDLIFKGVDEKQEMRVTTGAHGLHVKRGDLEFDTDKPIVIKRGDVVTLKIEWLKDGKLQVVRDGIVIGSEMAKTPPLEKTPAAETAAYALSFGGDKARSRVVIPSWSYKGDHPITLEVWTVLERPVDDMNGETLMGDPEAAGIVIGSSGKGAPWPYSFHLWIIQQGRYVHAREKQPLPRHQLMHLAGVYVPNAELRFYVNGRLQERTPVKGEFRPSDVPFTLGANPNHNDKFSDHFLGRMQGVRISKVARYDGDTFTPHKRFEPDKDTIALYQFDEGAGDVLKDSSGNKHDGKIVGAKWVKAEAPPPGEKYLLHFAAEDAVTIPSIKLDPREPITIEAYVRCDSVTPGKDFNPFFVGVPGSLTIYLEHDGSDLRAGCRLADKEFYRVVRKDVWTLGKRLHVAAVRTQKKYSLYVDGKFVGHKDLPDGELFIDATPFRIGGRINGDISEVRVSKAARYSKDFTPAKRFESDAETIALYHMDENSGEKLIDSSGNKHHGKISGARWVRADVPSDVQTPRVAHSGLKFESKRADNIVLVPSLVLDRDGPVTLEGYFTVLNKPGPNGSLYIDSLLGSNQLKIRVHTSAWSGHMRSEKGDLHANGGVPTVIGQRTHVALVRTEKSLRVFINGKLSGENIALGIGVAKYRLAETKLPFAIGSRSLDGVISEVRISKAARYDKDFTPQERFEPDANTIALYHFDEGAGDVLKDSSGNKHHGKIVGAKWVKVDGTPAAKPIDLLANFSSLAGSWKQEGAALLYEGGKGTGRVKVFTPAPMPQEYDLELVAERLEPTTRGGLSIGFIMGGSQAAVGLDAGGIFGQKIFCGLEMVDNMHSDKNATRVDGARLPLNEKTTIRVEIRKQGVRVFAEGDKIIDWTGHAGQLRPNPYFPVPAGKLVLSAGAKFRIHKLTLTPVATADAPPTTKAPGPWQPLLDDKLAQWHLNDNKQPGTITAAQVEGETVMRFRPMGKTTLGARTVKTLQSHHFRAEFRFPADQKTDMFSAGLGDRSGEWGVEFRINADGKVLKNAWGAKVVPGFLEAGIIGTGKATIASAALNPAGAWNRLDLVRVDDSLVCFVNGRLVSVYTKIRRTSDGKETDLGVTRVHVAASADLDIRRAEVRDISAFRPELIEPGPWQPLLDAKLTRWTEDVKNQPNVIGVAQPEGEPVLLIKSDGRPRLHSKAFFQNSHLRLEFQMPNKGPADFSTAYGWPGGKTTLEFHVLESGKTHGLPYGMSLSAANLVRGSIAPTGKADDKKITFADANLYPPGQWNRLDLVRAGDGAAFFINGRFLGAVADLRGLADGKVSELGSSGITLGCSNGQVLVRRIEVRDISAFRPELIEPGPWQPLLDAKLTKWGIDGKASISDIVQQAEPETVIRPAGVVLWPKFVVGDHHLRLEFQFPRKEFGELRGRVSKADGSSGLLFLVKNNGKVARDLWGGASASDAILENGAIVPGAAAKSGALRDVDLGPPGTWNRLDVIRVGDRLVFLVNGRFHSAVADLRWLDKDQRIEPGKAAFNWANLGEVLVRRIEVRDITALPPELLAASSFPQLDPPGSKRSPP